MIVLGLLLIGGGGAGAYMLIYSPLQDKKQAQANLQNEVDDLEKKVSKIRKDAPQVVAVKRASLPPDLPADPRDPNRTPTFTFAVAEYKRLMQNLLIQAGIKDGRPTTDKVSFSRAPITPEIGPKKPAYYTLTFQIEINKADLWQVVDFLYLYYQLDLLHQITDIKITRENKLADGRSGLKVTLTSEAIALDGVAPRSNLVPVASAVAAVGGYASLVAVTAKPELVQKLTRSDALASRNRDYSYIVLNDIFYGPVPPYTPPPPRPFEIAKLDNVTMKRDDKPHEVKVKVSGDGAAGSRIGAESTGSLIPKGSLTVDSKTGTITIPAIEADTPESATSTITVVAVAADKSTTKKSTFTVSVEPMPKAAPGPDIAGAIKLPIVSIASDGTATAIIKDNANPFRYQIDVTPKGIEITKWWQASGKTWKKDRDYDQPPGVLFISDEDTATKRTLKVIAVELNALIVCEIASPQPKTSDGKSPTPSGAGFRPSGVPARQGHAEPVAAVAGGITAAMPQPVYYRWPGGKSLKEVLDPDAKNPHRLKPAEVAEILRRVAAEGPVGRVVAASDGN